MKRIQYSSLITALVLACVGCAQPTASSTASNTTKQDKPSNSLIDETLTAGSGGESTASSPSTTQPPANSTSTTQPTTELVPAAPGVGKSGRKLDQYQKDAVQNMISTPARAYFQTKERIVFEIEIPHALQLYKAEHGEGPRSQEDFMRDIIEFNNIKLPELQAGQRYVYNPETEELMVERPKQ